MKIRVRLATCAVAITLATGCIDSDPGTKVKRPPKRAASTMAHEIPERCLEWIEDELLSSSSSEIDATAGYGVCGDLPDGELDKAIEAVTQDISERIERGEVTLPPEDEYTNGDYIVGEDIPAGTYETAGAETGGLELCLITTDPPDHGTFPQFESSEANERTIITLTESDGIVSINGCEPLKPRS